MVSIRAARETISKLLRILFGGLSVVLVVACEPEEEEPAPPGRFMYVSSGVCYSGAGNTTFTNITASNLVFRLNLANGQKDLVIADYNASPSQPGDSPVGLANSNGSLSVLVENTTTVGARRVDRIAITNNGARQLFSGNTVALSAALRGLAMNPNGDLLVSKSTAIEKITSGNIRLLKGANPWVSAPGSLCATSTTLISKVLNLGNQFIVFLHAATGQNRFGVISPTGYSTTADCAAAQAAPVAAAFPTAVAYSRSTGHLFVAYAGNSTAVDINSIYAYPITESASSVVIGGGQKIYDANLYPATYPFILYGISAMAFDSATSMLFVATAVSTSTTVSNYSIERFKVETSKIGVANTEVLIRNTNGSFYTYGNDTKCISDMILSN